MAARRDARGGRRHGGGGAPLEDRLAELEWLVEDQQKQTDQLSDISQGEHRALQARIRQLSESSSRLSRTLSAVSSDCARLLEGQLAMQAQIRQLGRASASMARELAALASDRASVGADQGALRECLVGADLLGLAQLRARQRVCMSLTALRTAVADPGLLQLVRQLVGDRGAAVAHLAATACAFADLRTAPPVLGPQRCRGGAPARPARDVHRLDESAWSRFAEYEPSSAVLDQWARSDTVHGIFGQFGMNSGMGPPDRLKFSDVLKIFREMGVTVVQLVNRFSFMPVTSSACDAAYLEEAAHSILRRFVTDSPSGTNSIRCADLYRLFEIVGCGLAKFKALLNRDGDADPSPQCCPQLGKYRVRRQIGRGIKGVCCYLAELASDPSVKVAVKWPASKDEVAAFKRIQRQASQDSLGLPRLLATGVHADEAYLVTELLGSPLTKVFECLYAHPPAQRWRVLRVIGRLMVRRIRSLHECGYVHCDISPENILLGGSDMAQLSLYLIDFELSQEFPGGRPLASNLGSAEWSSIRSADGGERLPEDDLEALGWVLVHGLVGLLPWFEWLREAYRDWDSPWTRQQTLRQVQRAKAQLLRDGWDAFGWRSRTRLPDELARFVRECCSAGAAAPGRPDYEYLIQLLGGGADVSDPEDLREFSGLLAEMDTTPAERAAAEERKARARSSLKQAIARKGADRLRTALAEGESAGLKACDLRPARSVLDEEELKEDARECLREAVAAGDVRRICAGIREAQAADLEDSELEDARAALDREEQLARQRVADAIRNHEWGALKTAIEDGELRGLPDEDLDHARRILASESGCARPIKLTS